MAIHFSCLCSALLLVGEIMNIYSGCPETSVASFLVLIYIKDKGDTVGWGGGEFFIVVCILMLIIKVYVYVMFSKT